MNKFQFLIGIVRGNADVLLISNLKFKIEGFNVPGLNSDVTGGGIMLHVTEDISAKLLITEKLSIDCIYVELSLRKQ